MSNKPTAADFSKWRVPIRGTKNPEVMNNPYWDWCIRTGESAYANNKEFGRTEICTSRPGWCFDRMGQATVALPDGRTVFIAGEHEDYYDPDFYIYNDVVVRDQDQIQIFGYPESEFPPTDFHTATLVGSKILLIGNLGYPADRVPGFTQVYELSIDDWEIKKLETSGTMPGWIFRHEAVMTGDEDAIIISGGEVFGDRILENFNEFRLCLSSLNWTQLTDRNWERWVIERVDGAPNELWKMRSERFRIDAGLPLPDFESDFSGLPPNIIREMFPKFSDQQLEQVVSLYQSPTTGENATQSSDKHNRFEFQIDGTRVRFDEEMYEITVTIEGELPKEVVKKILDGLCQRLSVIENAEYKVECR